MKVKSVSPAGTRNVFNMEVDDTHDFVLCNGLVAHNCYDDVRYMCMARPIAAPGMIRHVPKPYDPFEEDSR